MMPLALANIGEEYMIRRVSGNPEVKKHLEDLRQHHRQGEGVPGGHQ